MHSNNNIHIISIGGSVMHDLAINLKKNGNVVTGSDDKIYEPSKSNLKKNNLYPKKLGYHKENITKNLDFVITGMHTKSDNIELQTAKKNKIPIQSVQGKNSSDWILLDLGNIVINIMSVSARQYYDLESLWDDSLA